MCPDCQAIVQGERGAPGHAGLRLLSEETERPFSATQVHHSRYRCQSCGAKWEYDDNESDPHSGWSAAV